MRERNRRVRKENPTQLRRGEKCFRGHPDNITWEVTVNLDPLKGRGNSKTLEALTMEEISRAAFARWSIKSGGNKRRRSRRGFLRGDSASGGRTSLKNAGEKDG